MDGLALGVAGSLALRGMIDHPPCSILNLQHLAMASCRPGRAYDAPPQAAARLEGGRTLARRLHATTGSAHVAELVVLWLRGSGEHPTYHLAGKAARGQKAGLARTFARPLRPGSEFALPQLGRAL